MAKFCSNCGASISSESKFCPSCGSAINNNNSNQNNNANNFTSSTNGAKSRLVAGLLGVFLGAWGIHNFYLGYSGKGTLQLILTICSCGIAGIWGFIEGILILCGSINIDSNGNRLVD